MRRILALLGPPLLLMAAGCAPAHTGSSGPGIPANGHEEFEQRATTIAQAWRPDEEWTSGYVPLQDPTVLLGDPDFTEETKLAFNAGWYREQVPMPSGQPDDGTIRFPDDEMPVPLITAAEAYRQLDQGDPPPCPGRPKDPGTPPPAEPPGGPDAPVSSGPQADCIPLTVTNVELGSAPVHTSQGEAQVPAWLFTVEEIDAVVARIAVAPDAVGALPDPVTPSAPTPQDLVSAQDIESADDTTLIFRLGVGSCDSGITPLVQEHDQVVVVGGTVVRSTGVCDDMLRLEPVTVTLRSPLGARPVLDVVSASPLRFAAG
ncbi:hypothetical protein HCA58_13940 [Micromonospora sp. HNM0581]|uniref:hypothetical protein n=1 Tax=Micromonospora sp. HNM0581 TaxID=2716341 RepID=UPI00146F6AA7|nr:hypothetical protein [Micromonospora sp. HNM0581]NLU79464.1 hypothetical protein [Micromonospora sp. HNM0581]